MGGKRWHRKTYRRRVHGGSIESVETIIQSTPIEGRLVINNPTSKFIVATYWWGKENLNRNLQSPCPEDIQQLVKVDVLTQVGDKYKFPKEDVFMARQLKAIHRQRGLTSEESDFLKYLEKKWDDWVSMILKDPTNQQLVASLTKQITDRETARTGKPARTFAEMIKEWRDWCEKAGVNYVELNTEFPREDYQNAINGKPRFIKKVLDAVKDKGLAVVYIDGDMWMKKYPAIFDIDNVDFMARGWNMDPRAKQAALKKPAYDPYIFETSGGTMYFGNTDTARRLLDAWAAASSRPDQKGKADDRILSQIFTTNSMLLSINTIDLPIEYLWLTDNYKTYLMDSSSPASVEDAYIEHPYCLTGEERAASQGAAQNRMPDKYEEEISDAINYKRRPELFYEYIFFDGDKTKRDGFGRYLTYMNTAKSHFTNDLMIKIVPFEEKYGEFNDIAAKNPPYAFEKPAGPPGLGSVIRRQLGGADAVQLPLPSPIPTILKTLFEGNDVMLGGTVEHGPEDEVVATDTSTPQDGVSEYLRTVRIDTTKPMFLSGKSSMLRHLLKMCQTLEDINRHINGSYMFMSRIRWNLVKP